MGQKINLPPLEEGFDYLGSLRHIRDWNHRLLLEIELALESFTPTKQIVARDRILSATGIRFTCDSHHMAMPFKFLSRTGLVVLEMKGFEPLEDSVAFMVAGTMPVRFYCTPADKKSTGEGALKLQSRFELPWKSA